MNLHPDVCALLRKRAEREYLSTLPHYVYCVSDSHGKVKIGITRNIEQRKKQLLNANPDIVVLDYITTPNRSKAFEIEGEIHETAYKYHVSGEWFSEEAIKIFNDKKEQSK